MHRLLWILALSVLSPLPAVADDANSIAELDYGFSFDKGTWKQAPIPVSTLGEPCLVAVDGGPPKSLFVVFVRSSPEEPTISQAEQVQALEQKLDRMTEAIAGVEKVSSESVEVGGREALSYRMKGPGTGLGLGQGETTTVQHWFAVPRGQDLIVFQLTAAEENFDSGLANLQQVLESVEIAEQRPEPSEQREFNDEEIDVAIAYPGGKWIRGGYELGDFLAPGYLLRLWSAPSDTVRPRTASPAIRPAWRCFCSSATATYEPQELIDVSLPGLTGTLGAKVIAQEVREIAGRPAMWLLVEGKSPTGSTITGSGEVATRQLWVAIPRNDDEPQNILVFLLNTPAADYDARVKEFQQMLETLELTPD